MPPWELATQPDPIMWGKGGEVSWNDATYKLLGDPVGVEFLYNEALGRLGFRGVYYGGTIRIRQTDDLRWTIDIDAYLDELDLSLPAEWEATPALEETDAPGIQHQKRIVWIAIPTE